MKNSSNFIVLSIVAIVAIVSLVILTTGNSQSFRVGSSDDLVGEAKYATSSTSQGEFSQTEDVYLTQDRFYEPENYFSCDSDKDLSNIVYLNPVDSLKLGGQLVLETVPNKCGEPDKCWRVDELTTSFYRDGTTKTSRKKGEQHGCSKPECKCDFSVSGDETKLGLPTSIHYGPDPDFYESDPYLPDPEQAPPGWYGDDDQNQPDTTSWIFLFEFGEDDNEPPADPWKKEVQTVGVLNPCTT